MELRRRLELAALGLGIAGWLSAILTRCLSIWKVTGTVDNATAALPAYWDGVWLEWDHWDVAHDGSLHCSFYQTLLSLSGNFRIWRALVEAAVGAGTFAVAMGTSGAVWFPKRGQIKVVSGAVFVLSGILLLVPTAWTCHHTSQPLEAAVHLRRDWGPALYMGWISFALMLAGGCFLVTRCPTPESEEGNPSMFARWGRHPPEADRDAQDPLSTINSTAFTHSQYGRRSQPI